MTGESVEIEIFLLGRFELRVQGRPVPVPPGQRRVLLAALAMDAGRPVPLGTLVDYMWEDSLPENPRAGVQNSVLRLRKLVGGEKIYTVADGYLLDIPPERVDAQRFLASADRVASAPDRVQIDRTLALWRGDPLTDVGSAGLIRDCAPALLERYMTVLEAKADNDIAEGRCAQAIAGLRDLTARYRLRESLWSRLITALRASGRPAEALEAYENLRTILADELGSDPAPDLQRLHRDLLTSSGPNGPSAPNEPSGPSGPSGLSGLNKPDGGPGPIVHPARTQIPRQLPHRTPGFAGRDAERKALNAFLAGTENADDPAVIAVVHGAGGIGKTALAVDWAYHVRDRFPDGDLFVDLQGFGPGRPMRPGDALGAMLRALGRSQETIPVSTDERSALLRTLLADRRMLLLLDNARDAGQVRPLLPGSGSVVVVTSRNRLSGLSTREGACGLPVPELAEDDAVALLTNVLGPERIQSDRQGIAEIVELCRGLPLALRIAAERYASPGLGSSRQGRKGRKGQEGQDAGVLEMLSGDDPAADLRAIFSWSYDALAPEVARLFRRLGLHPGAEVSAVVAAVLLDSDVAEARRHLDRLTAVHLLEPHRDERRRMHDLVREYAIERADDESRTERQQIVRRLLDWYLHAANATRPALGYWPYALTETIRPPAQPLPDFGDITRAAQWCQDERTTILALAAIAEEHGLDDHVWELSRVLRDFLSRHEAFEERVTLGELGLAAASRLNDPNAIAQAAFTLGPAYAEGGQYDKGEDTLRIALHHAEAGNDHEIASVVLGQLGWIRGLAGDFERAAGYYREAVAAASRATRPELRGHALLNFSVTAQETGHLDQAIELADQALAIYREHGLALPAGQALANLAEFHHDIGSCDRAIGYAEQALAVLREHSDPHRFDVLLILGQIHVASDRPGPAREVLEELLRELPPGDPRLAKAQKLLAPS